MNSVTRGLGSLALSAVGVVGSFASADAAQVILFDDARVGGHYVSYEGDGRALTGLGFFDTIISSATPLNNGVELSCEGCALSYTTNENTFESADAWSFRYGGIVSLVGAVKEGINTIAAGTLLRGYFSDTTNVVRQGPLHVTVSGAIAAQMDENLSDFYGLDRNFWLTEPNGLAVLTQIGLLHGDVDPETFAFEAAVYDTDLNYLKPIPAPAALPLLLSALGGLGIIGWRRKSRNE